jgi:hypothetical protein
MSWGQFFSRCSYFGYYGNFTTFHQQRFLTVIHRIDSLLQLSLQDLLNCVYVMEPKNPPYDLAAFIKLRADTHEVDLNRVKLVSVFTVFGSEMLLLYPSISLLNNLYNTFFSSSY